MSAPQTEQQLRAAVASHRTARQLAWLVLEEVGGDYRDRAYVAAADAADAAARRVARLVERSLADAGRRP